MIDEATREKISKKEQTRNDGKKEDERQNNNNKRKGRKNFFGGGNWPEMSGQESEVVRVLILILWPLFPVKFKKGAPCRERYIFLGEIYWAEERFLRPDDMRHCG